MEYYYVGRMDKSKLYHTRLIHGVLENHNTTAFAASHHMRVHESKYREKKLKLAQIEIKGLETEDKEKRPNFGERLIEKPQDKQE